ncbi:NAD(P)H-dependent oxidoreductase [Paenibacillus sp. MWE-103]|uniref:NAD(P)H-dependent oxidoreductase n=1 Tax=Paenibacillus artemisiicola TaxID=1172618 RepID=A0ABS3W5U6_9BACL|nr:NAD(P)H-dependent oxidoreductase [Paenibacillus artemisiicola]MBO7743659.1 NAD(P)H-dependent oxidoreductase [Paenibacillus artemisiicola]
MASKREISKEQVLAALQNRHATKAFDSERLISDLDASYILEAGRLSPSSVGLEPWKFVVVQHRRLRDKLKPFAPGAERQLDTASHFVIILARTNVQYNSPYVLDHMRQVQQMPEEVVHYISGALKDAQQARGMLDDERLRYEWSAKQAYIALGNMMTAAALIGIDSCPMEGFDYAEVDRILADEGLLENGNFQSAVMLALGYRKEEPHRAKMRSDMEKLVAWR